MKHPIRLLSLLRMGLGMLLIAACVGQGPALDPTPSPSGPAPLQLDRMPSPLRSGTVGQSYSHHFQASGGYLPYRFELVSGSLPEGVMLKANGSLEGMPMNESRTTFVVRLLDAKGQAVQQNYALSIRASKPSRSSGPLVVSPEVPVPPAQPQIRVYKLSSAVLQQLLQKDDSKDGTAILDATGVDTDPDPTSSAAEEVENAEVPVRDALHAAQVQQMLAPMKNVEYPNVQLFQAALDAQLCAFARSMAQEDALKAKRPKLTPEQLDLIQAPNWAALAKRSASQTDGLKPASVSLDKLTLALMSVELRQWLTDKAVQDHSLTYATPIQWTGDNCGTALDTLSGQIYGIYPTWWATKMPQTVDFSMLHRISFFGIAFDESGNLNLPPTWNTDLTDFMAVADRHHTGLDFTLFRDDWRFLSQMNEADRKKLAGNLSKGTAALIHQSLRDIRSRMKAALPLLGRPTPFGHGVTLWFEEPQDPGQRQVFWAFYMQLAQEMAVSLEAYGDEAVLNLMVSERSFRDPENTHTAADLFDLITRVENPPMVGGRIESSGAYESRTHVTVRFLVPLPEPSTSSKKALRENIERASGLQGGNRRVFLRKVIPILANTNYQSRQFSDDLAYMADNFGGVGFWPMPLREGEGTALQPEEQAPVELRQILWSAFHLPDAVMPGRLARIVSEHRWIVRILFDVMILAELVAIALYLWNGHIRKLGRTYLLGLCIGGLLIVLLGVLLLNFDPQLSQFRKGNTLLWLLIAVLSLSALFAVLKPRVEKP